MNGESSFSSTLAHRFNRALETILRSAELAPESFCFVRYEDLVAAPKREAARLGAFCGPKLDAFDPDADWQRMAISRGELARRPSFSPLYGWPVSAARVGRFRERLIPSEIAGSSERRRI